MSACKSNTQMENYALPINTVLKGASYNYRIQKVLGQGTFGITYLASIEIKGSLGSINSNAVVAIKEFFMKDINDREDTAVSCGSKGGLYEEYKKKFAREAKNLSKLDHPNIIKVLEAFEENNTVYYVMEYIDGGSLNEYIEQHHGLSESESIKYFLQIASALSYMHANKMLHLDMKPANVMRRKNGDIILIDFGLSKQYDENGIPESSTTVGGGTPGYAPIEQAHYHEGKDFPITMDIYALGATLFKMLTGIRPPEASVILNDGFPSNELVRKQVSQNTIDAIEKAMAPTKKNRHQSVDAFKQMLTYSSSEDTIFEDKPHELQKNKTKYNWVLGGIIGFLQILFAVSMTDDGSYSMIKPSFRNWGTGQIMWICLFISLIIFVLVRRNTIGKERWNTYKWIITIACIFNSCSFGIFWDMVEIEWYLMLSYGLAIVSGYTFAIKSTESEDKFSKSQKDKLKYNWLLGGTVGFLEILFALIMVGVNNVEVGDAFSLWAIYDTIGSLSIILTILIVLVQERHIISKARWNTYKWIITIVCLLNSYLLLASQEASLAANFILSCGLAIASGYTFAIKPIESENKFNEHRPKDQSKYDWLLGSTVGFFLLLFTYTMWGQLYDFPGNFFVVVILFIGLTIFFVLIKRRSIIRIGKWNTCKWIITIACIYSSLLFPLSVSHHWHILSGCLSGCLAIASGCAFAIKSDRMISQ